MSIGPFEITPQMQMIYRDGYLDGCVRVTREMRTALLNQIDEAMNHQSGFEHTKGYTDALLQAAKCLEKVLNGVYSEASKQRIEARTTQ